MSIAVIVPAYNCQSTIERCIKSILGQTTDQIKEIVIVDDGSKDDTNRILKKWEKADSRIQVIQKQNGGVSSARNVGMSVVTSEWLMFVDSDDEIKEELVQKMIEVTSCNDLVIAGVELHQKENEVQVFHEGEYTLQKLIENYGINIPGLLVNGSCAKLYKKEIIEKNRIFFDEKISLGEDTIFVFEYLKYCENIAFVKDCGYIYYQMGTESLMTKFRVDAYDNAKKVYSRLMETSSEICNGIVPESIYRVYKNVLMVYIRKIIYHRRQVDHNIIKNILIDYSNDVYVRKNLEKVSCKQNLLQKVIDKLTLKKNYNILMAVLIIHVTLRGI